MRTKLTLNAKTFIGIFGFGYPAAILVRTLDDALRSSRVEIEQFLRLVIAHRMRFVTIDTKLMELGIVQLMRTHRARQDLPVGHLSFARSVETFVANFVRLGTIEHVDLIV
jgi:hypothetical protein